MGTTMKEIRHYQVDAFKDGRCVAVMEAFSGLQAEDRWEWVVRDMLNLSESERFVVRRMVSKEQPQGVPFFGDARF